MRGYRKHLFPLISILLLFSVHSYGQAWSGVLASSRAINWGNAGLPATLPDGETTPNPWTPPTRTTQCGATITPSGSASTDTTNINKALAACPAGQFVLLGPGSFTANGTIVMYTQNGVTLRGSGPQSTTVTLTSGAFFEFGAIYGTGSCTWSSGFAAGATQITLTSCSNTPQAGEVVFLSQCNTGLSGAGCTSGTQSDNGGIFVCGGVDNICQRSGEGSQALNLQQQAVFVTSVTNNSGTYTVNFSPGLYMANWSSAQGPAASWTTGPHPGTTYGNGLEDMTIYNDYDGANQSVQLNSSYASWIKGVRFLGSGSYYPLFINSTKNCLIANSYFFSDPFLDGSYPPGFWQGSDSDDLVINNVMTSGVPWEGAGSSSGDVIAYNYTRDTFTAYVLDIFEHIPGDLFALYEGNETPSIQEDNTHGTHDLNTAFRNYVRAWDAPYAPVNQAGITWNPWDRFTNAVGNVIGTPGLSLGYQNANPSGSGGYVFSIGYGAGFTDTLTLTSSMRWGNWDSVTNAVRWCGNSSDPGWSTTCSGTSEVPSNLPSPNTALSNPVPANTNLPCSFYFSAYGTSPCQILTGGGTGFSWWKVCTSWSTFPTSCATNQTPPFPAAGPDLTGGPYDGGYAYDIPAALAWQNLPIDPAYQKSFAIASSNWSGGTETLTFSSGVLPNTTHLLGGFQLQGVASACNPSGGELLMTNSSSTTVSYALTSNPGTSCTGTMLFPDVRQFDERVYQNDPSGAQAPQAPSGLQAVVH
jgi:hypothetical protein